MWVSHLEIATNCTSSNAFQTLRVMSMALLKLKNGGVGEKEGLIHLLRLSLFLSVENTVSLE